MRWRRLKGESGTAALKRRKEVPDDGHNKEGWTFWPWERMQHYFKDADCWRVPCPRHPGNANLYTVNGRAACGRTFRGVGGLFRRPEPIRPICPHCQRAAGDPAWQSASGPRYQPRPEKPRQMTEAEKDALMRALPEELRPNRYKSAAAPISPIPPMIPRS